MPAFDDSCWDGLSGGYRVAYDARPALRALAENPDAVEPWNELWENLHHQGDVGEASYAALTALVEMHRRRPFPGWNLLALAATIEAERHALRNPRVPSWLMSEYSAAWRALLDIALDDLRIAADALVLRSAMAVVALARSQVKIGALLASLDESEIDEWADEHLAWSENYRA